MASVTTSVAVQTQSASGSSVVILVTSIALPETSVLPLITVPMTTAPPTLVIGVTTVFFTTSFPSNAISMSLGISQESTSFTPNQNAPVNSSHSKPSTGSSSSIATSFSSNLIPPMMSSSDLPANTPSSSSASSSSSLSKSTQIGLRIGMAFGALVFMVLSGILTYRYLQRRKYTRASVLNNSYGIDENTTENIVTGGREDTLKELTGEQPKPELDGTHRRRELPGNGPLEMSA